MTDELDFREKLVGAFARVSHIIHDNADRLAAAVGLPKEYVDPPDPSVDERIEAFREVVMSEQGQTICPEEDE